MDKREYAEKLYAALEPMAHAGRVEDAWGGELLSEFDDLCSVNFILMRKTSQNGYLCLYSYISGSLHRIMKGFIRTIAIFIR